MTQDARPLEIGLVVSVNPARRELRLSVEPAHEYQFKNMTWVRLTQRDGRQGRYRIADIRALDEGVCITLVPGVLRDTVARLKGARAVVLPDEYVAPPHDALPFSEVVGFDVVGPEERSLGTVTDVFPTPAHDVVEIELVGGTRILVPAVDEVVTGIDWKGKRLRVNDLKPFCVEE